MVMVGEHKTRSRCAILVDVGENMDLQASIAILAQVSCFRTLPRLFVPKQMVGEGSAASAGINAIAEGDLEVSGEHHHGGSPCLVAGPQLDKSGIAEGPRPKSAVVAPRRASWRCRGTAARRPEEASVQSGASCMGKGKGWGDGYTTIAPPPPPPGPGPPPAPPARGPPGPPPAPFACGFHAHSDCSQGSLAYAVNSGSLQSGSKEKLAAFHCHLESTLFQTDQDNFYHISAVISKLCEEEKIDVIGCKTKANRFVQVVCKQCGQYAHARYTVHTKEEERQEGRNRIYKFLKQPVQSGKPTV